MFVFFFLTTIVPLGLEQALSNLTLNEFDNINSEHTLITSNHGFSGSLSYASSNLKVETRKFMIAINRRMFEFENVKLIENPAKIIL